MENENKQDTEVKPLEIDKKPQQMPVSTAIVLAGALIMIGIIVSKGSPVPQAPKTLSEQVGVSKESLASCIKSTDLDTLQKNIDKSVDSAMSAYAQNERGTPYSVVIGLGGIKTDMRGAYTYENAKKIIDDAMIGKVSKEYTGNVALSEPTDHIQGSDSAKVTIIEYSDFECPYCKQFHPVLERIVKESGGDVKWVYRHYPLHQHSVERLIAAECVAKIKGNDAFWKYGDLLFGLLKTSEDSTSDQL